MRRARGCGRWRRARSSGARLWQPASCLLARLWRQTPSRGPRWKKRGARGEFVASSGGGRLRAAARARRAVRRTDGRAAPRDAGDWREREPPADARAPQRAPREASAQAPDAEQLASVPPQANRPQRPQRRANNHLLPALKQDRHSLRRLAVRRRAGRRRTSACITGRSRCEKLRRAVARAYVSNVQVVG